MDAGWRSSSWLTADVINQSESDDLASQVVNGETDESAMLASYSLTETILISAALLTIIFGTIIGNILVCTAVCLVRRL